MNACGSGNAVGGVVTSVSFTPSGPSSSGGCGRGTITSGPTGRPPREPERELEHARAEEAPGDVVPELVDGDDEREHHEEERDRERILSEELDEPAHQAPAAAAARDARTDASIAMISRRSGSLDR